MKKIILLLILVGFVFTSSLIAQDSSKVKQQNKYKNKVKTELKHGQGFVDANGDGYNDNAPDHDGDGIPNGLDEDYINDNKRGFIDEDGDGINDYAGQGRKMSKSNRAKFENSESSVKAQGAGAGSGTGNKYGSSNSNKGNTSKGKGRGNN